ncbi:hypothetical protein OSTOST_00895, partial [Ostertagia ostertagi]
MDSLPAPEVPTYTDRIGPLSRRRRAPHAAPYLSYHTHDAPAREAGSDGGQVSVLFWLVRVASDGHLGAFGLITADMSDASNNTLYLRLKHPPQVRVLKWPGDVRSNGCSSEALADCQYIRVTLPKKNEEGND